jgi:hypothetical protein
MHPVTSIEIILIPSICYPNIMTAKIIFCYQVQELSGRLFKSFAGMLKFFNLAGRK